MDIRHVHLRGATGHIRTAVFDSRDHLVVPVVALMEGVIHAVNASTPEMVPLASLSVAPQGWNGRPVVLGHPARNGRQISANDPKVLEQQGIGHVFDARIEGKKLLCNAYIDPIKAEKIGAGKMLERLRAGDIVEVSVGAFVVTEDKPGDHLGKPYKAVWAQIAPDHLAMLPNGIGACSAEMGCGTRAAMAHVVTAEELVLEKPPLRDRITALMGKFLATAPDISSIPDEELEQLVAPLTVAKAKMEDCATCHGSGNKDGNPCPSCDGNGEMKAAIGARHSGTDREKIQTVHDHAVDLGATCDSSMKAAENNAAPCGCKGAPTVAKTDMIKALIANPHSGFTAADEKMLEAADEARLTEFQTSAEKKAVDVKAMEDDKLKVIAEADVKVKAAEAKLKAAEAQAIPAEELIELRALAAEKKAMDASTKADLVASLKTAAADIFTEDELNGKSITELSKLAQMVKLDTPKPDYSGRALPRVAAQSDRQAPPDAYEAGLNAMRAAEGKATIQ